MKFDSNRAWQEAAAAVSANREVLLALAGVFFLLPGLVVSLLFPQPQISESMGQDAAMQALSAHYARIVPFMVPVLVFQATGTLAMLTLLTDRSRPTVGHAIRRGLRSIVPYLLAQLLVAIVVMLAGSVLIAVFSLTGVAALGAVGLMAGLALAIYALVRTSLIAPVVTVEGVRAPVTAIRRSLALTRGHTARIVLFYALVMLAFFVGIVILTTLIGIVLSVVASEHLGSVLMAVVSSALGSIVALYFAAIIVSVHRQLAGESPAAVREPFE